MAEPNQASGWEGVKDRRTIIIWTLATFGGNLFSYIMDESIVNGLDVS